MRHKKFALLVINRVNYQMFQIPDQISVVPTNIITGFLGAGKTSTILQLLKNKPEGERWAVLVNEFGEIGIDGALIEGQYSEDEGVFIREVPGGCMCCTAGMPMRVALTQLLRRAKPDRLLIEPTGLGHPTEVIQTLTEESFRGVIAAQKIVTVVDARHLSDKRYLESETFNEQISIADVVVGNKHDLYNDNDKIALQTYLQKRSLDDVHLVFTERGNIEPALLEGSNKHSNSNAALTQFALNNPSASEQSYQSLEIALPDCGYIKAQNEGEGFVSIGWRFSEKFEFNDIKLFAFLSGIQAQRLKATFITSKGSLGYNITPDSLTEIPLEELDESRIEIIAHELNEDWEQSLFDCVNNE